MRSRFSEHVVIATLLLSTSLLAVEPLASRWHDGNVTIDGVLSEWPALTSLDKNIVAAATNDLEHLYLLVATSDAQRRRQLALSGLIVWFDTAGGKKESYGIRIAGAEAAMPSGRTGNGGRGSDARGGGPFAQPPDLPAPTISSIELLGPGNDDRRRLEISPDSDFAVAAGVYEGMLLYEFRIPLATTSGQPQGLGATAERPLGIGFEIPRLEPPQGGPQRGGGDPQGRAGGFGGRGGFGGGGGGRGFGESGGRGQSPMQMDDVKFWTTLTLARGPR